MAQSKWKAFGIAIKAVRESKGWTHASVAEQAGYSDGTVIGRIEREGRRPPRDRAVDLLVKGLRLKDRAEIDRLLGLLAHAPLTEDEASQFAPSSPAARPILQAPVTASLWKRIESGSYPRVLAACLALGPVIISIPLFAWGHLPIGVSIGGAGLYSALFVVSLLLETAYAPQTRGLLALASFSFGFVWFTTLLAEATAGFVLRSSTSSGIVVALAILFVAAAVQWIVARDVLPDVPIIFAAFRPHTAQGAHLKNISYNLFAIVFFWLLPVYCALARSAGHEPRLFFHLFVVAKGGVSLSPELLWGLVVVLFGISLVMRTALLDRLKPHPSLNRYHALFYLRAGLYFALLVTCALWFTEWAYPSSPP